MIRQRKGILQMLRDWDYGFKYYDADNYQEFIKAYRNQEINSGRNGFGINLDTRPALVYDIETQTRSVPRGLIAPCDIYNLNSLGDPDHPRINLPVSVPVNTQISTFPYDKNHPLNMPISLSSGITNGLIQLIYLVEDSKNSDKIKEFRPINIDNINPLVVDKIQLFCKYESKPTVTNLQFRPSFRGGPRNPKKQEDKEYISNLAWNPV